MYRTLLFTAAFVAALLLVPDQEAFGRGCGGGGRGGRGGCGGGGGGCGGGGCYMGGGGFGGCGYGGGFGGGYVNYGGCASGSCGGAGAAPFMAPGGGRQGEQVPAPKGEKATGLQEARLIINLPADARLNIGGQNTTSTSGTRVFLTPALETGYNYTYTVRAEVTRNGETNTIERTVSVRPGEDTHVSLELPTGVAAR